MYRGKPIPPGFLLITLFLACVAVVPPAGADVIQGDPGVNAILTPTGSFEIPAFAMVPGSHAVPSEPAAQKVLSGTQTAGNFTFRPADTVGEIPWEIMSGSLLMIACPEGYGRFCVESPGEQNNSAPNGFATARQLAYFESGKLSQVVTTPEKSVEAAGTRGLQFAGVSETALAFSPEPCAAGSAGDFAYSGYRGSGSRASVSSPHVHYSCRF